MVRVHEVDGQEILLRGGCLSQHREASSIEYETDSGLWDLDIEHRCGGMPLHSEYGLDDKQVIPAILSCLRTHWFENEKVDIDGIWNTMVEVQKKYASQRKEAERKAGEVIG
jgi:hypothetical protein